MYITDFINISTLQKVQDEFSDTFQLPTVIYDLKGERITQPTNYTDFYRYIQTSEKGKKKCKEAHNEIIKKITKTTEPTEIKGCIFPNIISFYVPIIINNIHIATFMIGQMLEAEIPIKQLKKFARKINIDENKFIETAKTLKRFNRSAFNFSSNSLKFIIQQIIKISIITFPSI